MTCDAIEGASAGARFAQFAMPYPRKLTGVGTPTPLKLSSTASDKTTKPSDNFGSPCKSDMASMNKSGSKMATFKTTYGGWSALPRDCNPSDNPLVLS
ncbi:hypothetical protein PC116_g10928 [Phytophthora cactorum]|nr:hypothetical protein Pcac1_g11443 [Phytophthora cactorum]KAG4241120.1 hypothetical protein PC116_g10928 [Phytophthora cactorum]